MLNLLDYAAFTSNLKKFNKCVLENKQISVYGLAIGERTIFTANLNKPFIYVATDEQSAAAVSKQFASLGILTATLTSPLNLNYYSAFVNDDEVIHIASTLSSFVSGAIKGIIVTPKMLLAKLPSVNDVKNSVIKIELNSTINYDEFIKALVNNGYILTPSSEKMGDFCVRGDIIEIITPSYELPIRIEFFGNTVDAIYTLKLDKSISERINNISIYPVTLILNECNFNAQTKNLSSEGENVFNQIKLNYENGLKSTNVAYTLAFMSGKTTIFDYLNSGLLVMEEPKVVYDSFMTYAKSITDDYLEAVKSGWALKEHLNNCTTFADLTSALISKAAVCFCNLVGKNPFYTPLNVLSFNCTHVPKYIQNFELLIKDLQYYLNQKFTIILCNENKEKINSLYAKLSNNLFHLNICAAVEDIKKEQINLTNLSIYKSACFTDERVVIVGTQSLYGDVNHKPTLGKKAKERIFYLPKVGDYVVHETNGVGKCVAIKKLNFGIGERDYFVLEYAKGSILYLPTEHADKISQFIGADEPALNVLGSNQFEKAKERARESVKKLAFSLQTLYAERKLQKGYKYSTDEYIMEQFQAAFGYELTDDQAQAIEDISNDMEQGKLMDRLVCGDVGFGKTEVALVAAFKTILSGKQVAFMSPTTVLCEQHYNTVVSRMMPFMVNAGKLNRFNSTLQTKNTLKGITDGSINIVCGTHRLLSADVCFKDLGLLILDEEQRFGVGDKEKIKRIKKNVNVLTLSATPIPRTLHMSLSGIRDVSLITTPPAARIPVQTVVTEFSNQLLTDVCHRELERDGQVLILYNRVETINEFASTVKSLLPDVSIDIAHGKMNAKLLEDVLMKMYTGATQILIATTLIENGIDLPKANTLIVIDADKFGLSQLYQLRGRVGRSNRSAYAYFTYQPDKNISSTAYHRLEALREFTTLGSGFKIAMRDLQLRGAGNILGAEQSGHMDKIGYDLYNKLLMEAINELSGGEKAQQKRDITIQIALPAFLPDKLVKDEAERIKLYNQISYLSTQSQVDDFLSTFKSTYNDLPIEVIQLAYIAFLKNLGQLYSIKRMQANSTIGYIEFYADFVPSKKMQDCIEKYFTDKLIWASSLKTRLNVVNCTNTRQIQQIFLEFLKKMQNIACE